VRGEHRGERQGDPADPAPRGLRVALEVELQRRRLQAVSARGPAHVDEGEGVTGIGSSTMRRTRVESEGLASDSTAASTSRRQTYAGAGAPSPKRRDSRSINASAVPERGVR